MKKTIMSIFRVSILLLTTFFTGNLKAQLDYGSYLGGSNSENITSTITDKYGNTYFAGYMFGTNTPDLPVSSGAFRVKPDGTQDFFIYSLDPAKKLRWCTYLGTSGQLINERIQIAFSKNANEGSLLVAFQSSKTGYALKSSCKSSPNGYDIVLLKFDLMGKQILGTYYGGQKEENMGSICVNNSGELLLLGSTSSNDSIATPNSYCYAYKGTNGAQMPFFVKLDTNFNRLFGSYAIPSGLDNLLGSALYVTGCWDVKKGFLLGFNTYSTRYNPSGGSYQTKHNGGTEMFVSRFDNKGVRQWATYLGGIRDDNMRGITCDSNACYVLGTSNSSNIGDVAFGKKSDSLSTDLLIAAFDYNGVKQFIRYFGGKGMEEVSPRSTSCIVKYKQHLVVVGYTVTFSSQKIPSIGLATDGAYKDSLIAGYDGIISIFDTKGNLKWSSYMGSFSDDYYNCVDVINGRIIVAGKTSSTSGVCTTGALFDSYSGGISDGFFQYYQLPFRPSFIFKTPNRQCLEGNKYCIEDNSWSLTPILSYRDTLSDGQLFSKSYCFNAKKSGFISIKHHIQTAGYSDYAESKVYTDSMPKPKFNITLQDYDAFNKRITHKLSNQTDKINIKSFSWYMDSLFISSDPLGTQARTDLSKRNFKLIAEHVNGCRDTANKLSQYVSLGVSVGELDCRIMPNPFADHFNIESANFGFREYKIINAQGLLVKTGVINIASDVISLNNVGSGLYFLSINGSPQMKLLKTPE